MRKTRPDVTAAADFKLFHKYVTGKLSITEITAQHGTSSRTLHRKFEPLWLIPVPQPIDQYQVHDQIFLDGTYLNAGCLLIASTDKHVLGWVWTKEECTAAYVELLSKFAPPLCVVIDGGKGVFSAIKQCWPHTAIQRCLYHARQVVRRHTSTRPRTPAGKALYKLAKDLPLIRTQQRASKWLVDLQDFGTIYHDFLNEKSWVVDAKTGVKRWDYTHAKVRQAYNSLAHLAQKGWLFTYLDDQARKHATKKWKHTTNCLEGMANAGVKLQARLHRGLAPEHQRTAIEWYLATKMKPPVDHMAAARRCHFGQDQLAKVELLRRIENNTADQETGRPAVYDNGIPMDWDNTISKRKTR